MKQDWIVISDSLHEVYIKPEQIESVQIFKAGIDPNDVIRITYKSGRQLELSDPHHTLITELKKKLFTGKIT